MNLFEDAYRGRILGVSAETHAVLRELFPEVDTHGTYRDADSWLVTCAPKRRPKNCKRFLVNWFKRERQKMARESRKQDEVAREIFVGSGPEVRRRA